MEDRTLCAVRAHLAGMRVERYEVGILNAPAGKMLIRAWGAAEVEKAVPWLKRQNARGHDIYIRPEGSGGIVLIDDLTLTAVERLRNDGLAPAVVVETSPRNFQAWVRVAAEPIAPAVATAVGRELATRYGADMNSAQWRHFGRAAGFTNQKKIHTRADGRQPYVRLHEWGGQIAPGAWEVLQAAQARAAARSHAGRQEQALLSNSGRLVIPHAGPSQGEPCRPPQGGAVSALGQEYRRRIACLLQRYPSGDPSRLDWMVTKDLARAHPEASRHELMQAMREGSPRLDERKAGHVADYVLRTTTKVLRECAMIRAIECDRGRERG